MTAETLNIQLLELYQTYTQSIYSQTWDDNVSAPLLMHVFDEYCVMENKILFVGQETHSWGQMNLKPSPEELLNKYRDFNLGKSADYGDGKPFRYLRSPFWNFNRNLFFQGNWRNSEVTNKTNGFLWTNISKFDCNSTTPSHELQDRNKAGFELLKAEISILKPDVVVFLTGSKYDHRIDEVFKPTRETILPDGYLYRLSTSDGSLPPRTFQTKHPRTLLGSRRNKMPNRYQEVLGEVVECGFSI
ncbi:hypothetical protein MUK70_15060 [Dyadobacter chenwenxiniae]|uniref:Uracil-DNA glycosylase-like domain-containing protein n=1 Tax=Dyadobacter chenwenxiniae TaxID=2906456 RepID=A0A9X1PKP4_9BACT|nr:uracil-DNA glycosylase family protein [Dyadobacter chenwenxiniae]MCF0060561.1 hypothetical protein [Dyadobacter chenwenxiniae]UON86292.1 hypothetical protein MUK70_15060 [Dyadobacter chenwenxiniae]